MPARKTQDAAAKAPREQLVPTESARGPSLPTAAIYGGALVFGTLASALDALRLGGAHAAPVVTGSLAALYLVVVALAIYLAPRWQTRLPRLADFLALTPSQFESVVGDLLRGAGYAEVRRVGGAGDLGADLVCRDARGRSVIVQCKRYDPDARVGSPAIQTFIGMLAVHHRADAGIFVTTSAYTRPAQDLAREHDIALVDGAGLVALAAQVARARQGDAQSIVPESLAAEPDEAASSRARADGAFA